MKRKSATVGQMPSSEDGLEDMILDMIIPENRKILDLGCGCGNLSKKLLEQKGKVTSVDIEKNYKHTRIRNLNNDFNLEDKYDFILALELIEHLENPRHFLRQCKKLINKNGQIIISTPKIDGIKQRLYFLFRKTLFGFRDCDYEISGHINPMTVDDFRRIAKEEDMDISLYKFKSNTIVVTLTSCINNANVLEDKK